MPRLPRFFAEGLAYHLIQRGNNRCAVFRAVRDYRMFLSCLNQAARDNNVLIHAFALMTTHTHLLVTPARHGVVPRMMQAVGRRYVRYFNRRHNRTGGLWEGRYRAFPVVDDEQLLACMRYIDLNPVRGGIVKLPEEYEWSTYRPNAFGTESALIHIQRHHIFETFGDSDTTRQANYRRFCTGEVPAEELEEIRFAVQFQRPLGGSRHAGSDP
jgi:REP-associated tyrosine transposase